MKLLFWNTKSCDKFEIIKSILNYDSPDFLFLAEIDVKILTDNSVELLSIGYTIFPNPGCDKINILKKRELKGIELSVQHNDYSALHIKEYDLYIISLHMPSQMAYSLDALRHNLSEFKFDVENSIGNSAEKKILLIGDFNVNPFESPIVNYDGLSATNTINFNVIKTHRKKQNHIYYNPTWKLYSQNDFPGTFIKKRPSNSVFDVIDHHYLDQVILSHNLKESLKSENINIIRNTPEYLFCDTTRNRILISDHLPLKYEFEL